MVDLRVHRGGFYHHHCSLGECRRAGGSLHEIALKDADREKPHTLKDYSVMVDGSPQRYIASNAYFEDGYLWLVDDRDGVEQDVFACRLEDVREFVAVEKSHA